MVGRRLEQRHADPETRARPFERLEPAVLVERGQQEGDGQGRGEKTLGLIEDREGLLLAATLAPAAPQLAIPAVLLVAEASHDDQRDPPVLEPAGGRDE